MTPPKTRLIYIIWRRNVNPELKDLVLRLLKGTGRRHGTLKPISSSRRQSSLERRQGQGNDLDEIDKKTKFQSYHHRHPHHPYENHVIKTKGYYEKVQRVLYLQEFHHHHHNHINKYRHTESHARKSNHSQEHAENFLHVHNHKVQKNKF